MAANALELARSGTPKKPFYLTGSVSGKPFSVHAEGERFIMMREEGHREEIDLTPAQPSPVPAEAAKSDELPVPVCPQGIGARGKVCKAEGRCKS